jgi:hypothetical protein
MIDTARRRSQFRIPHSAIRILYGSGGIGAFGRPAKVPHIAIVDDHSLYGRHVLHMVLTSEPPILSTNLGKEGEPV